MADYRIRIEEDSSGCGTIIGIVVMILVLAIIVKFCSEPKREISVQSDTANTAVVQTEEPVEKDNVPTNLFDLPLDRLNQGDVKILSFSKYEHIDLDGYIHKNCYMLLCKGSNYCVGYSLDNGYTELTGHLYAYNSGTECWLDFYSGDTLIYSTPHLSDNIPSTDICIDISNVDFLSIYFRSNGDSSIDFGWLIAENFIIT